MRANKPRLKVVNGAKSVSKVPDLRTAYQQQYAALKEKVQHAQEQISLHNQNISFWGAEMLRIEGAFNALNAIEPQEPQPETPAEPTETPAANE